uniref:TTF-type domain-containing protein n=1 Tax=Amphimedon queenslandica TaxID=400682 RepID=A0A1X7V0Y7_AMPQE
MSGSSKRSFPPSWYNHFKWLEHFVEKDRVYCFPCRFIGVSCDPCLTVTGFCNWKNGKGEKRGTLDHHSHSTTHINATLSWNTFKAIHDNDTSIVNQLETGRVTIMKENRQYVAHSMEVILCCGQQGIALRSHREVDDEIGSVNTGNFRNILKLCSRHMPSLANKLANSPWNATFRSPHVRNGTDKNLRRHFLQNGMKPRVHGNTGHIPCHALSVKGIKDVVTFLENYAEDYAILLPERIPGVRHYIKAKLLPSSVSRCMVYRQYADPGRKPALSESSFKRIWRKYVLHIYSIKPMTDSCWTCKKNSTTISQIAGSEIER